MAVACPKLKNLGVGLPGAFFGCSKTDNIFPELYLLKLEALVGWVFRKLLPKMSRAKFTLYNVMCCPTGLQACFASAACSREQL